MLCFTIYKFFKKFILSFIKTSSLHFITMNVMEDSFATAGYDLRPDTYPYQVQERTEFRPANVHSHDIGATMRYPEHEQTDRQVQSEFSQRQEMDFESMDRARQFIGISSSLETRDPTWQSVVQPWVTANGLPIIQNTHGTDLDNLIASMGQIHDKGQYSHVTSLYDGQELPDEYRHPGNEAGLYKTDRIETEDMPVPYAP